MPRRERLSVAVVTHNEAACLPRCLRSVAWSDEILVVDSRSTDGTVQIARREGARVIERDWPGYAAQKRYAVEQVTHDWVLSLDADEWLDPAAIRAVQRALEAPCADGFRLNRLNAFSGGFLRHAWSPDWQLRLFRRDRARVEGDALHEAIRLASGGRGIKLAGRMPHLSYRSIGDYVARLNRYTDLAAAEMHAGGQQWSVWRLLVSPPAAFFKQLVVKRGFLDGTRGLVVAAGSGFYALLKQAKLWELTRAGDPELVASESDADVDRAQS